MIDGVVAGATTREGIFVWGVLRGWYWAWRRDTKNCTGQPKGDREYPEPSGRAALVVD